MNTAGVAAELEARRPAVSTVPHRVGFYQTDAMGIMHHANYLHLLEDARVRWMEEHHESYRVYVASGLHFAVTQVEIRYRRSARFDDAIRTRVWLERLGRASLVMAYELRCGDELLATAQTEHAMVDLQGRLCRIPRGKRAELEKRVLPGGG